MICVFAWHEFVIGEFKLEQQGDTIEAIRH